MTDDHITISTSQFIKRFPNAEAVHAYFEAQRWPQGALCPACGCVERIQPCKRSGILGYYRCLNCKAVFTVRTGTIFERSHVPLNRWMYAMYLIATARKDMSSIQLSKEIGVTQKTAWFMLQRLRTERRESFWCAPDLRYGWQCPAGRSDVRDVRVASSGAKVIEDVAIT